MSGFSADWLALREPADASARSHAAAELLADIARRHARPRIVDLGTGTGSNMRFLAPRLGGPQEWLLTDSDVALLEQLPARMQTWCAGDDNQLLVDSSTMLVRGGEFDCRMATLRIDLANGLAALDLADRHIVTASALLDLVSEEWLVALIERCRQAGTAVLFALTYDGRMRLTPNDQDDEWIRELVNIHQQRDKGFGPALGPDAAMRAPGLFAAHGYEVHGDRSDWNLGYEQSSLQRQLIDGWASAAAEIATSEVVRVESWRRRRMEHIAADRSQMIVGHRDLVAWPA